MRAVTYHGQPVRFRTFERRLPRLAVFIFDLSPEIVVDASNWREESGPL